MQDRYTGDIGDYFKYALLRSLVGGRKLGVAWYLFPDEDHNSDGRHIGYLNDANIWRSKDPILFEVLSNLTNSGVREVKAIEEAGILGPAVFTAKFQAGYNLPNTKRAAWREAWFDSILDDLENCEVIFADPDNGLCLDKKFRPGRRKDWKRIPLSEAKQLADRKTAIIYHHNTRRPGGHIEEIKYWLHELGNNARAIRYRAYSSRTFFILNPHHEMHEKLDTFSEIWGEKAEIY